MASTVNQNKHEAKKKDDKAQTQDSKQLEGNQIDQHEDETQEEAGEAQTQDVKELDVKQILESCLDRLFEKQKSQALRLRLWRKKCVFYLTSLLHIAGFALQHLLGGD